MIHHGIRRFLPGQFGNAGRDAGHAGLGTHAAGFPVQPFPAFPEAFFLIGAVRFTFHPGGFQFPEFLPVLLRFPFRLFPFLGEFC